MAKLKATQSVSLAELDTFKLPEATDTFTPVAHGRIHELFTSAAKTAQLDVRPAWYKLAPNGEVAMGCYNLNLPGLDDSESRAQVGWMNSWDKSISARVYMAEEIRVCSNGMVFALRVVARKHTPEILNDLPGAIAKALGDAETKFLGNRRRIAAYKGANLTDKDADHLLLEHWRRGVFGDRQLKAAHDEYRDPQFAAFKPRNVWSFHNAVTETLKRSIAFDAPHLTTVSNDLLDSFIGFDETKFAGVN